MFCKSNDVFSLCIAPCSVSCRFLLSRLNHKFKYTLALREDPYPEEMRAWFDIKESDKVLGISTVDL